jgi:hypothetical protein
LLHTAKYIFRELDSFPIQSTFLCGFGTHLLMTIGTNFDTVPIRSDQLQNTILLPTRKLQVKNALRSGRIKKTLET